MIRSVCLLFMLHFNTTRGALINENTTSTPTDQVSSKIPNRPSPEAIQEIAYYLRAHKFNEYDRRYETDSKSAPQTYYRYFPEPPLRSLHWEVHKFCEISLEKCVEYIRKRIKTTGIRRHDDTAVVISENNWSFINNSDQINQVDEECRKAQNTDDKFAYSFEGPIERFQWRTTASYFMCLYTMIGDSALEHLSSRCDNFANCLDRNFGPRHRDPRANDTISFSCAMYSFCPDPCCTQRHMFRSNVCWEHIDNPCYQENPPGARQCSVERSNNQDLRDMILNRWNVTCNCPDPGFHWNSLYGMCVDVNECTLATRNHTCDSEVESCMNLKGSYKCTCKWGYSWNNTMKKCVSSATLLLIKLNRNHSVRSIDTNKTLIWKLFKIFGKSGYSSTTNTKISLFVLSIISIQSF